MTSTSMLVISTRKGLFVAEPAADTFRVTRGSFIGDNVTLAMVDPRGGWYAALDHGHFGVKLHRSDDRGLTWNEIASPKFPPQSEPEIAPSGRELKWSTSLVWALAPALDHDQGLWCGTLPGGLFRSDDRGATWRLNEALWFHPSRRAWVGGGADEPGIHSIVVDPRDPRTVVVAVSCGGVWRSRDAGASWHNVAKGMRAAYMPPERAFDVDIQDPHLVVQCAARPTTWWSQHHNGIFRSTDDLATWTEIEHAGAVPSPAGTSARPAVPSQGGAVPSTAGTSARPAAPPKGGAVPSTAGTSARPAAPPKGGAVPSTFGFAVVVDPADPDTAWFIPGISDQKRVPVDGKLVVTRTRDGGKTFDVLSRGLPDRFAYDLVFRHAFAMSTEGALAFGTTTGNVFASADRGDSWTAVSHHLPPVHAVTFAPD